MKALFLFRLAPVDAEKLFPQVCRALEYWTEQRSRSRHPGLWKLTDSFNGKGKAPEERLHRRRQLRLVLSLIFWALGLFLLVPFLYSPKDLVFPGLAGGAAFALSTLLLWRNQRKLLGILGLATGGILTVGTLGSTAVPVSLLYLGAFLLITGIFAFTLPKRAKRNRFETPAVQMLQARASLPEGADVHVSFTEQAMVIQDENEVPFDVITSVLETEDLFFVLFQDRVFPLQKKELADQKLDNFRTFLEKHTKIVPLN